ncbi:MAG TPA: hypothetical protein VEJ41_08905, partial [Candidatus Acidoferrales bacterium]|nr:hypothetical protein [Candidatus Acidoferrales bacterium]
MRTEDDVILCSAAGADALGFIFASSPARLDVTVAAHIARQAPAAVERVGVFAEQDRALICDAIERVELDVLQFCGGESAEFRGSFGLPTIVVVGVGRQGARSALPAPASLAMARACAILIDSHHGAVLGGTGMRIDT